MLVSYYLVFYVYSGEVCKSLVFGVVGSEIRVFYLGISRSEYGGFVLGLAVRRVFFSAVLIGGSCFGWG